MLSTSGDLVFLLQTYFSADISLVRSLYILTALVSLWPLWRLHRRQTHDPRQPALTGWSKSLRQTLQSAAQQHIPYNNDTEYGLDEDSSRAISEGLHADAELVYELLGISPESISASNALPLPPIILCTTHVECVLCDPPQPRRSLRRRIAGQKVKVLTSDLRWREATLFVAHCVDCLADYYPDFITYSDHQGQRRQKLDCSARYLRISKHGIWAERRLAWAQEHALIRFHSGWANFANWVNDLLPMKPLLTNRQSQRLFLEHFTRRLLVAHGQHEDFSVPAHSDATTLAAALRDQIGADGGVLQSALTHGCTGCTHVKRYYSDLEEQGAILDGVNPDQVADIDAEDEELVPNPQEGDIELPRNLAVPAPIHQGAPVGEPRGYVQLAVMDGKTITHKVCALDDCRNPLVDYRRGRFCEDHIDLQNVCGIVPCGRQVAPGEVTCDLEAHRTWYRKWQARFTRMSFAGVQRVIRRQQAAPSNPGGHRPNLQVQLPPLADTPGHEVVHTFRAKTTYCLETIQWACGMPIGWGKCYKSESTPQVLDFINRIWPEEAQHVRPSFIVFDDACDLLRHIVTQDPGDAWVATTKFVVDAWHYIGHKATDVLCRLWCNPAPRDGSQPDLVVVDTDDLGNVHLVRAFNTETAEQFNAWLSGFEGLMRSMTNVNYDFFVHVLFLVYSEEVEERIRRNNQELDEEFWDAVEELL
ncbi:hypothetical protein DICSQDRAFT_73391 [Dichomitus squalens LYAD-421 SS1]|uniref:CxC5 like cysteine cluster associated with KDZ domain-containing protein n=1 Tax=Dichomitus squalens (strain LYAD-421) TaxID=732165 RepID=R7SHF9_DICSQ|nr:uncharacterized protein DICSQDRAFT_73391 [Dichomitus squalens LYAD-421 SS1]EJF55596.1 hypothetical protein DICSQDRAFT_73391 [Dichomitus squalens LYAD-421 SS1]